LFVNFWATWCTPCREEFPGLVRLHEFLDEKPVDLVGISVDYPDEIQSKINPFLSSHHVKFQNYVKNVGSDQQFINLVNPHWSGSIPVTVIYGTNGKLRAFIRGKRSFDFFKKSARNSE
jgi:thiol-disulfide isomerase/thioredoxin